MKSKFYKTCAVPQCKNTTIKTPEKIFIYVPLTKNVRKKWLQLACRNPARLSPQTRIYFCEDHFDLPNDMENYTEYHIMGSVSQVRMKSDCLPTKFECQFQTYRKNKPGSFHKFTFTRMHLFTIWESMDGSDEDKYNHVIQTFVQTLPEVELDIDSLQARVQYLCNKLEGFWKEAPSKAKMTAKHGPWLKETEECDVMLVADASDETDTLGEDEAAVAGVEVSEADSWMDLPDVCRCCLAASGSWDLTGSYMSDDGEKEVLLDMLRECFGIKLSNLSEFGPSRFVCDVCVASLRQAYNFWGKVLRAEERFSAFLREKGGENLEIKNEAEEEQAIVDIFEADEMYEDVDIKIEEEDEDIITETSYADNLETIARYQRTGHSCTDNIETIDRSQTTGRSSTDNIETIDRSQTTGRSSTDNIETIDRSQTTGRSSRDNIETTKMLQRTGLLSTDNLKTKERSHRTGHSSTNKSKTTQHRHNTDHSYTKKLLKGTYSNVEENTETEMLTCVKGMSSTPTLLIKPLMTNKPTKKSDQNLAENSLYNESVGESSSAYKKVRKMSSSSVKTREVSSGGESIEQSSSDKNIEVGSEKVGKNCFNNKKVAVNSESDSDTPISQLCKKYTDNLDDSVFTGFTKGRSDVDELNLSPKVVCKAPQYAANVKQISERKRIRLTCDTILKDTTACPFRHHKSWFQCFYCTLELMTMDMLRHHTKLNHTSEELTQIKRFPRSLQIDISEFQCKICNVDLFDVENMITHFLEVHQKVVYKECIADYKVNDSPYSCHLCCKQYHVFRTLTTHLNEHYANCICDVCGKSFLNSKRLKVHKRTHESGSFPCSVCGKVLKTKTAKANHTESAHSKRVIKCHICLKPMKHYNDRIKHMSEVHNITHKFKCPVCSREFNIKHYLATHMRQTHGHKNKNCSECDMAFITNHGLKKHMLKHTGVKAYPCTLCNKSFARSYTLKEHMRGHEGEAKFADQ